MPKPDDVIGVVHLLDFVNADGPVAANLQPPMLLPETLTVADGIRLMRHHRQQFALVVDERGGIDCIVTLEDLLEGIVGEICASAVYSPSGSQTARNSSSACW